MKTSPLKKWRLDNGVTQLQLAKRLDSSQALISHYELKGLPDSIVTLRRISTVTGIPVDELRPVCRTPRAA